MRCSVPGRMYGACISTGSSRIRACLTPAGYSCFRGDSATVMMSRKLVLGICNGFQVLVKAQILPGFDGTQKPADQPVSITNNDTGKFEDRWVYLEPATDRCVFIEPGRRIYLPVAHAEGKLVTRDAGVLEKLNSADHVAFRYVDADGCTGPFPVNPNGSVDSIAGLTDSTGRVLGLMPHPERFIHPTHHPHWTRLRDPGEPDGMTIFNNAVNFVRRNL